MRGRWLPLPAQETRHLGVTFRRSRRWLWCLIGYLGRRRKRVHTRRLLDRPRRTPRRSHLPVHRRMATVRRSLHRRLLGPIVPVQPSGDQGDENVLAERFAEGRPEDDVGIDIGALADLVGRQPDLAQSEVGRARNIEQDPASAIDARFEKRAGDRLTSRIGRTMLAAATTQADDQQDRRPSSRTGYRRSRD